MKTVLAAALLAVSLSSLAAEVEYQHPDLTIVAREEPLDSVLKAISREMRIFVTIPTGLNPVVNCDIRRQPVDQVFKKLLGGISYSLEWENGGERLVGVTILASSGESAVAAVPGRSPRSAGMNQPVPTAVATGGGQAADATASTDNGSTESEHAARRDTEREEIEARMAEERAVREAEVALRRQKEEIAREARMREKIVRHEAEMAAYLESQGIRPPR